MDELWTRIAIIAAALAVAALVVAVRRTAALKEPRELAATGLPPGVYLFTSADCADCAMARVKLEEMVGEGGFQEIAWEQRPDVFTALDVDAVPATMIVEADGTARLWLGVLGQPNPDRFGP